MGNTAPFPRRQPGRFLPNPKLKFLDQCRGVMSRVNRFAPRGFI